MIMQLGSDKAGMANAVCGSKCVLLKVFKINNIQYKIIQYKIQTVQSSDKSTFLLPPLSGTLLISPREPWL